MNSNDNAPTIVIDIDNTIIDTSVRKQKLLKRSFSIDAELIDIKNDYHLAEILGADNILSNKFLYLLDTSEVITECSAIPFPGACETIEWLTSNNFVIIFLTSRLEECREVTLKELNDNGIECKSEQLIMRKNSKSEVFSSQISFEYKKESYLELSRKYNIVAAIGDRPEDIQSAQLSNIPAILITTTVTSAEIDQIINSQTTGVELARSWPEIAASFKQIHTGIAQMEKLRTLFISQYSQWLYDIDEKISTVVTISSFVSAIAGHQVLKITEFNIKNSLLLVALFLSVFSILYCIRGLTSRRTSGPFATSEHKGHVKQSISILLGGPTNWHYRKGDAIDKYTSLRSKTPDDKAAAHLAFFHDEYGTFNPQALLNMRMLELRSAVYIKSYAERIASKLLMVAIVLVLAWILIFAIEQIKFSPNIISTINK
ncbi:MAG: HAD family acid phosphatase [Desulfurivibrionaceae bacterium]